MLTNDHEMYIASAQGLEIDLNPSVGNRHGLVSGATGTGKTVTLQNLAESFSALGTPVFLTDVKGDLAGLSQEGRPAGGLADRVANLNLTGRGYRNQAFPVCFWDVGGKQGHPIRTTVSSMGPMLLSRLLNLNETQSGLMHLAFRLADDKGLLLLDFKDIRSLFAYLGQNSSEFRHSYGNIAVSSIGAVQRELLRLEDEGAEDFFGEPSLRLEDLFLNDLSGRGQINILAADRVMRTPRLYSAILLWLLSALFEQLPEVGDPDKPRLVLLFDEAHLLFTDAPPVLVAKIEQVVRLIRSKGVGVYFCTQSPSDLPDSILAQLGHRIQHALRAYTPKDQKAVRAAAQSFRANPAFKTEEVIAELGIGEALVSFLDIKGRPAQVERALILPPESQVGAITPEERQKVLINSRLAGRYDAPIDRESAYEILADHFSQRQREEEEVKAGREAAKTAKEQERLKREADREARRQARNNPDMLGSVLEDVTREARRTVGRELGRRIIRGVLGGIFGGKR